MLRTGKLFSRMKSSKGGPSRVYKGRVVSTDDKHNKTTSKDVKNSLNVKQRNVNTHGMAASSDLRGNNVRGAATGIKSHGYKPRTIARSR